MIYRTVRVCYYFNQRYSFEVLLCISSLLLFGYRLVSIFPPQSPLLGIALYFWLAFCLSFRYVIRKVTFWLMCFYRKVALLFYFVMPVISQILFFDIVFDLGRGYYRDGLNEFQKAYFLIKRNLTFAFLFWFFFFCVFGATHSADKNIFKKYAFL